MPLRNMVLSLQARLRGADAPTPVDIAAVKAAELRVILGEDAPAHDDAQPWGLALSGGGIRSATFGLGALQALARGGMLSGFHYLSTVSGGGYIGGFLQALIRRRGFADAFAVLRARLDAPPSASESDAYERLHRPLRHLREYSNYLAPRKSPLSGDTLAVVGTVVRNVALVQMQLGALLLALVLLPLLLRYAIVKLGDTGTALLPLLGGALGIVAVALVGYATTSAERRPPRATAAQDDEAPSSRVAIAATVAVALLAAAMFTGGVGMARFERLPAALAATFDALRLPGDGDPIARLAAFGAALYAATWMAWLLIDRALLSRHARRDDPPSPLQRHAVRFMAATLAAATFAGGALVVVHGVLHGASLWHAFPFGPLLILAGVMLTGIVHLGLAGPALGEVQREIWARVGGYVAAVVVLGMTLPLALTLYGPWLFTHVLHADDALWSGIGWSGVLAWLATTGFGLLAARDDAAVPRGHRRALEVLLRIAPWVFVLGAFVLLSYAGQALLQVSGWDPRPAIDDGVSTAASLDRYLAWLDAGTAHSGALPYWIAGAAGLWLLLGWAVDGNEFSLNAFYRNRLVRCYLGASSEARNPEPISNLDVDDDLVLADVVEEQRYDDGTHTPATRSPGTRPLFPLIGTALNLVAAKQLDWQDRKAASFVLTPGFCGHLPPASRAGAAAIGDVRADIAATASTAHVGKSTAASLTLGSAIAISGAAVNPSMGARSSPALGFLLTLFDARLGWWLPNLSHPMPPSPDDTPFFGGWLLAELLGRVHAGGRYVHLSDGGHFENLGVYELVRRRCRFVLCVDAGCDQDAAFADLGNAVQKCRVDFGVDIVIDLSALRPGDDGLSARDCALGRIDYPDGTSGTLLYVRPALTGAEPTDVQHYARAHPRFPHEPTSDQYFDEAQFESYRRLGEDAMARALAPVRDLIGDDTLSLRDEVRRTAVLDALAQRWTAADDSGVHG